MKIAHLLPILLQIVLILPHVHASWLNDGVCRPNVPCVDFDDLSNLIEGCIDSGLYEISLDACSSAPVYKLRYQRHIIINSPNDITLFCSEGLSCVLRNGSDADDVIEEVRGGMFYFIGVASLHIKNVVFDGTSPSRQKKLTAQAAGGLVHVQGADEVTVSNSQFINGRAGARGGALSIYSANSISITNTMFIGDEAFGINGTPGTGGAVFIAFGTNVYLDNTSFTGCSSGGRGGGAFISAPAGTVETSNGVFFERCRAGQGGGMYVEAYDTNSNGLRCNSCDVPDGNCGGCIAVKSGHTVNLEDFNAVIQVDEADDTTICVRSSSSGELLDPIYVDWNTMQGATPFEKSGIAYSSMNIAQGYWCSDTSFCPISDHL